MVDEFSAFARMPAPVMKDEDLAELVRQTVFLQQQAHPEIGFGIAMEPGPWRHVLDSRQIRQALTNLLQNAIDAIGGRDAPDPPPGRIDVALVLIDGRKSITVADNGRGLPTAERERLTEPYVTTRAKGTGLGLAIVKKIMEDHAGELRLDDNAGGGARVALVFGPGTGEASPTAPVSAQVRSGHGA
jgi:two-component system nitrogen regulation sensor histidine kinase NtrY